MPEWIINSGHSMHDFLNDIRELYQKDRYIRINAKTGKARSLDQNEISHVWYEQISFKDKQYDKLGWKNFCKLHFGVPILRSDDAEFREFYDMAIKKLTYEQKISAMSYTPVTSIMTKNQLSKYLEEMKKHFEANGIILEFPSKD